MKVLLDTCIWGGVKDALFDAGYDVIWTGDWDEDPGDDEILAYAYREGRVLSPWTRTLERWPSYVAGHTPGFCGWSTCPPSNSPPCPCVCLLNMGHPFKWARSLRRNWTGYGFASLGVHKRRLNSRQRETRKVLASGICCDIVRGEISQRMADNECRSRNDYPRKLMSPQNLQSTCASGGREAVG